MAALSLSSSNVFETAATSVNAGTELKLMQKYRGVYNIDYVNGFHSGRFAYFVTRQPKAENSKHQWPIISKLVRICTADKNFYSYTEVRRLETVGLNRRREERCNNCENDLFIIASFAFRCL